MSRDGGIEHRDDVSGDEVDWCRVSCVELFILTLRGRGRRAREQQYSRPTQIRRNNTEDIMITQPNRREASGVENTEVVEEERDEGMSVATTVGTGYGG